jgi:hypothetical protein
VNRVLLLGSTGAVGAGCLDVLARCDGVSILVAGRDEERLRAVGSTVRADVQVARLDVADLPGIVELAARCDVVVNCAGPSYRFSADVAGAAAAAGVPYVDPGGDQALLDQLAAAEMAIPVVLQAGVQPGLSGLVLRALALRRSGHIASVTVWCGGLQHLTRASVHEYLASLHNPHNYPAAALRDRVIRRVRNNECEPAPAQYFPDSVTVHPHLDAEIIAVAAHLGIDNLCWLNVLDGSRTKRAMQLLAADDGHSRRESDLPEALAAARLDLFGREPYFAIVSSARGDARCTTLAVTCRDSYRVTGALAAVAAQRAADMPPGVHPFWTVEDPWDVVDFLADAVQDVDVSVVDDTSAALFAAETFMIEEGSL